MTYFKTGKPTLFMMSNSRTSLRAARWVLPGKQARIRLAEPVCHAATRIVPVRPAATGAPAIVTRFVMLVLYDKKSSARPTGKRQLAGLDDRITRLFR